MLVTALRRIELFATQHQRDLFAIFFSAALFGVCHFALWGPYMAFAVAGLGFGFGLAYIAIGERLLPVIVYHIIFDFLSLLIAIFAR